jgi:hypothetical protein
MGLLRTSSLPLTLSPHDRMASETYIGQAHFALSGPPGKTCGDCRHFADERGQRGRCQKFTHLTDRIGKPYPAYARSCKYFEEKTKTAGN